MKTYPKTVRTLLYLLTLAAIVWYPARLIWRLERPKVAPQIYQFEVQSYDPYDPFRGRYLQLRLLPQKIAAEKINVAAPQVRRHKGVLAFTLTAQQRPELQVLVTSFKDVPAGCNAIPVRFYRYWGRPESYWSIKWPFDRFYLNEKLAPEAEALLQNLTRTKKHRLELQVAIYADGLYAVRDLWVDGQPLVKFLRQNAQKPQCQIAMPQK